MSRAAELDQYYTHPNIAKSCFKLVSHKLKPGTDTVFLEPSAGAGAFFNLMPASRRIGLDLEPRCEGVTAQDFFTFTRGPDEALVLTVGNPPFGKNSSLAVQFFNHAAEFSTAIAFIVPKTFRKVSLQKRLHKNFSCILDEDLPKDSFVFNDEPYDVPCCFQIWKRSATIREHKDAPLSHVDFSFVGRNVADFAVRRVGALAGKVIRNFSEYSSNSHYFLKAHRATSELIAALERIDWSEVKANNAGNPSISKRELVAKYSESISSNPTH